MFNYTINYFKIILKKRCFVTKKAECSTIKIKFYSESSSSSTSSEDIYVSTDLNKDKLSQAVIEL